MNDQDEGPEAGKIVMTKSGHPGKYVAGGLALSVVRGGLVVAEHDPEAKAAPGTLCPVHDLEVLAASVMWHYLKRSPA